VKPRASSPSSSARQAADHDGGAVKTATKREGEASQTSTLPPVPKPRACQAASAPVSPRAAQR